MKRRSSLVFKSIIVLSVLFFLMESILSTLNNFRLRDEQMT